WRKPISSVRTFCPSSRWTRWWTTCVPIRALTSCCAASTSQNEHWVCPMKKRPDLPLHKGYADPLLYVRGDGYCRRWHRMLMMRIDCAQRQEIPLTRLHAAKFRQFQELL